MDDNQSYSLGRANANVQPHIHYMVPWVGVPDSTFQMVETGLDRFSHFWQSFVKRLALCYRTVVCPVLSCPVLSYLSDSVTLAYCGQTIGWIKMSLGMF